MWTQQTHHVSMIWLFILSLCVKPFPKIQLLGNVLRLPPVFFLLICDQLGAFWMTSGLDFLRLADLRPCLGRSILFSFIPMFWLTVCYFNRGSIHPSIIVLDSASFPLFNLCHLPIWRYRQLLHWKAPLKFQMPQVFSLYPQHLHLGQRAQDAFNLV